ncbi:MAG: SPOR domain-containing protein [Magnetococcales bacterium]|nr:SPOR domain-containing protein [Magnetococcales bacterium]
MTPRYPTSARFRRHQRQFPLLPVLGAALLVGVGVYALLPSKPEPAKTTAQPPQEVVERAEQAPRSPPVAPERPSVVKTESKPQAEAKLAIKPESRQVPVGEPKPAPQSAGKAAPSLEKADVKTTTRTDGKPDLQAANRPESKPDLKAAAQAEPKPEPKAEPKSESRSSGRQEIKLEIKPESLPARRPESRPENKAEGKAESAAKKGESKGETESGGKGKEKAVSGAETPQKPPLLPQPNREEESSAANHPLPDALPPRPREQEMDLTFYKGLANKRMILPEEPPGKKVIPPFLASYTPTTPGGKRIDALGGHDKSVVKPVAPKPLPDGKGVGDAHPSTEAKKAAPENKTATEARKPPAETEKPPADSKKQPAESAKKKSYQVQIAILSDLKNATALVEKLRAQGAGNPRISTLKYDSGRSVFRVRLGPFASQGEAAKAGQRWQTIGQPALITAVDE